MTRKGRLLDELDDTRDDLTLRAFEAVSERFPMEGYYHFTQSSDIPTGRGLGSSGAAIAAGLLLARAASNREISIQELVSIGVSLEGHPDNVVASLLGGLTLCQATGDGRFPLVMQPPLHESIGFAVAWPGMQLATQESRAVLPSSVPFAHAVENPGRLAYLLEGLRSGSSELLRAGEMDRLHVPYRLDLIPASRPTLKAARAAGAWLATISGSGSALIALGPKESMPAVKQAMCEALAQQHEHVEACIPEPVFGTPVVQPF